MTRIEFVSDSDLTLRESVYRSLRLAILHRRIKEGERLKEMQIARMLGVSRTPVREAFFKLQKEGLILLKQNVGAVAAPVQAEALQMALENWEALESYCIYRICSDPGACPGWDKEEAGRMLAQIRIRLAGLERTESSLDTFPEEDMRFHRIILRAPANDRLMDFSDQNQEILYRFRLDLFKNEKAPEECYRYIHQGQEQLMEALLSAREQDAVEIFRTMLHLYREKMDRGREAVPDDK